MPAITARFALSRSLCTRAPKQIYLLQVHNTADWAASLGVNSKGAGFRSICHNHIEHLPQIPTQMIDVGYFSLSWETCDHLNSFDFSYGV